MSNISEINKLIRDVVNLLLSSPTYTIAGKQKRAPRPKNGYADVNFLSDRNIGLEQHKYENDTGSEDLIENISGQRAISLSIGFYRNNASDNARKVRTGLVRESIQAIFSEAGIGLLSRSEVREFSEPLENGWEERAQFDIVLSAVGTDSDIVDAILGVDISAQFEARGLVYNSNINVNEE